MSFVHHNRLTVSTDDRTHFRFHFHSTYVRLLFCSFYIQISIPFVISLVISRLRNKVCRWLLLFRKNSMGLWMVRRPKQKLLRIQCEIQYLKYIFVWVCGGCLFSMCIHFENHFSNNKFFRIRFHFCLCFWDDALTHWCDATNERRCRFHRRRVTHAEL